MRWILMAVVVVAGQQTKRSGSKYKSSSKKVQYNRHILTVLHLTVIYYIIIIAKSIKIFIIPYHIPSSSIRSLFKTVKGHYAYK